MTHVTSIDLDTAKYLAAVKKLYIDPPYKKGDENMIDGIGQKAIDLIKQQAENLVEGHKRKIQEVFLRAEDEGMKISLGITLKQVGTRIAIKTTIAYVVEKVGDEQSGFVDENQPGLFPVQGEKKSA